MTEDRKKERVSRKEAAERLVDIAYALTAGWSLEVEIEGEVLRVPVADELLFERVTRSTGNSLLLELGISWSIESTEPTAVGESAHAEP